MFRRYLSGCSLDGQQNLKERIQKDPEPYNRLLLLRHPRVGALTPEEKINLGSDRSFFVRREYFAWRIARKENPAQSELEQLALEKNQSLAAR